MSVDEALSLGGIEKSLKNGEESTALLLALAWSPIETLAQRGLARIYVDGDSVIVSFANSIIVPGRGLLPTV